jgi:hypothetical protein
MLFRKQPTRIARATTTEEQAWQANVRAQTPNTGVVVGRGSEAQCWPEKACVVSTAKQAVYYFPLCLRCHGGIRHSGASRDYPRNDALSPPALCGVTNVQSESSVRDITV